MRLRIREIANTRVRYGYKRVYIALRREGATVNHKRVYRLYSEEGLTLRGEASKASGERCAPKSPAKAAAVRRAYVVDGLRCRPARGWAPISSAHRD